MSRTAAFAAVGIAVALVLAALLTGGPGDGGRPLDPASTGPLGTRALVVLLEELGVPLDVATTPGDGAGVALLLRDRGDRAGEARRRRLVEWVRQGGTLVVADPRSPLTPEVAGSSATALGVTDEVLVPGRCDIDALDQVGTIEVGDAETYRVAAGARSCFGNGRQAFVVARTEGDGVIVALGNASPLVNERLGEGDNAVLAATLLQPAPARRLAVIELPPPGTGDEDLLDLVPTPVWRLVAQLVVAFGLFAAWRGRRLGRPVVEASPVEIEGSELIRATGVLWQRRRDPGAAASVLLAETRAALAARVGLPADAPAPAIAAAVAARTGTDPDRVLAALDGTPVPDDAALVALADRLDGIRQEVLT